MGAMRVGWARGCLIAGLDRGAVAGPNSSGASVPRARSNVTDTAETSDERASERCALDLARAPSRLIAVGRCWCRWRCGGPERALGAALASGPDGVGELATRVVGCPCRGGCGKEPSSRP
jgi:hypothetical protein